MGRNVFRSVLLAVSIGLFVYAVAVWPLETKDAQQDTGIAVLHAEVFEVKRRVTAVEERLFSLFLGVGSAVAAAVASAMFSHRTYRELRNRAASEQSE